MRAQYGHGVSSVLLCRIFSFSVKPSHSPSAYFVLFSPILCNTLLLNAMHIGDWYRDFPLRPACCRNPLVSTSRQFLVCARDRDYVVTSDNIPRFVYDRFSPTHQKKVDRNPRRTSVSSRNFFRVLKKFPLIQDCALNRTSMVTIFHIINRLSVSFQSCFDYVSVLFVCEKAILDFIHVCFVVFGCAAKRPYKFLLALRVLLQTREMKNSASWKKSRQVSWRTEGQRVSLEMAEMHHNFTSSFMTFAWGKDQLPWEGQQSSGPQVRGCGMQ
jgi:hypothetical protein